MDIIEFLGLTENKQWDMLWAEGHRMEKRNVRGTTFELYALHGFFVEVKISGKLEIPSSLMPFKDGPRLDKYIYESA